MGILEGKNILVTGVLTEASIAFDVAKLCQQEGAKVVLTGVGRTLKVTQSMGRRLPQEALVVELDVTNPEQLATLADSVREHVPHLETDRELHRDHARAETILHERALLAAVERAVGEL